jgi:hypothetical protein
MRIRHHTAKTDGGGSTALWEQLFAAIVATDNEALDIVRDFYIVDHGAKMRRAAHSVDRLAHARLPMTSRQRQARPALPMELRTPMRELCVDSGLAFEPVKGTRSVRHLRGRPSLPEKTCSLKRLLVTR